MRRLLVILALFTSLAGCSHFDAQSYADAAEKVARAKASGLGEKHPRRIQLESEMQELASEDPQANQAALVDRREALQEMRKSLRESGLGEGHPKVRELDRVIENLD